MAGRTLVADAAGTLFAEDEGVLIVADLHLEKGSSLARRGMFLPPYDTAATLGRLAAVIDRYAPRCVVALGDSFHDGAGSSRLAPADRDGLRHLQRRRDWIWIAGNHDPEPPAGLGGEAAHEWQCGPLVFRHEPLAGAAPGEIAGHLHPVALVAGLGSAVRRRSFVSDATRCVMPAFGAYAGGLNLRDRAFRPLFRSRPLAVHALGRDRVYPVPAGRCLPE